MSENPNGPGEPASPNDPDQPQQPAQPVEPAQPTQPPTAPPAQPGAYPPPGQQPPAQPYGQQPPAQPGAYPPPGGYPPPGQQPPAYGQQPPAYGQQAPGGYPPAGAYPPPPGGFPTAPPESGTTQPAWATGAPVTVGQAVSYGWSKFWSNAGVWIGAVLVVFVIAVVVNLIFSAAIRASFSSSTEDLQQRLDDARSFGNVLLAAIGSILTYVAFSFLVSGALATTHKGRAAFADFFRLRNVGQVVLLAVVVGVLSFVLGYLGVIGSIILLVLEFFLTFALYFVLDTGQDAFTAIRSSFGVVGKNPGVVIVLILAAIGIAIVGAIICFVGLLAAVPIGLLAYAFAYRRLTGSMPL